MGNAACFLPRGGNTGPRPQLGLMRPYPRGTICSSGAGFVTDLCTRREYGLGHFVGPRNIGQLISSGQDGESSSADLTLVQSSAGHLEPRNLCACYGADDGVAAR